MSHDQLMQTAAQLAVQRALTSTQQTVFRHGTVIELNIDTYAHFIQLDADGITIQAHDTTHLGVNVGDRVTVIFTPPHQALIVGAPRHDPWHLVGTNQQVQFHSGWGNMAGVGDFGQDLYPKTMFKRMGQLVTVRGTCTRSSGTDVNIFELPVGYRPRSRLLFGAHNSFAGAEVILVTPGGFVQTPASISPIVFHNIHFMTS